MDLRTYIKLSSSDEQWFCDKCGWPFNFTDLFFETSLSTEVKERASTSFVPLDYFPRSSNGFINCLLLNVRSLRNKINDLSALFLMDSFDVVAEAWLNDDFSDSDLMDTIIFRFDTANPRGSVVLLAINSRLSCNRRYDLEIKGVEMLVCKINTSGSRCLVFSVFHRPPNAD